MQSNIFTQITNIVTLLLVAMFFSCESNIKDVSKIYLSEFIPISEAENIHLKHTDSGRVKAVLISSKMLDYSNARFPYTEFPQGVHIITYDDKKNKTNIFAEYGISYSKTKTIELKNRVKIITYDNKTLETDLLYYNTELQWFFTDEKCKFSNIEGDYSYFKGFDCSKDFKKINAHALTGETTISE